MIGKAGMTEGDAPKIGNVVRLPGHVACFG